MRRLFSSPDPSVATRRRPRREPAGRAGRLVAGVVCAALVLTAAPQGPAAAGPGTLRPVGLRAAALTEPIGLDDATPDLSWRLTAAGRNATQSAYQVRAATDERRLRTGRPDLWDTGKVTSAQGFGVTYAGEALTSRARVVWQVRVWDGEERASAWSDPASFELGLRAADWSASWIGNPQWERQVAHPITVDLTEREARYVRLDVRYLEGSTVDPFAADRQARLQLAEIEVGHKADPAQNLARDAAVTVSESDPVDGAWDPRFLTDGRALSGAAPRGWSSRSHPGLDVTATPIWVVLDLGAVRRFDQVRLYPRSDLRDQFARTANYPRDFSVGVATDPAGPFTEAKKVSRQQPPSALRSQPEALPQFAADFAVSKGVRSARLYVTGSGMYDARLNGRPVSTAVLEPPNTDVTDQLVASTYDVTGLLRAGANRIGVELGQGLFDTHNTPAAPKRFQYVSNSYAPPRLLAQLEVTYVDGSTETVGTGGSWRTGLGATTYSNWYGGEDFDARRDTPGWDRPGTTPPGWESVAVTATPLPGAEVVGRTAPPIEPVESFDAVAVTEPEPGTYVIDFGVNVAGWPEVRLDGPAGTEVELRPAEKLDDDGTITQSGFRGPVWDTVTLGGDPVRWHPRFMYHGFRYLQVTGLPTRPTPEQARAIVLRTTNDVAGSFTSSNELLNGIHGIIDRAVQGNMYSVLTDCPHREKLGWLEQYSLVFGTVSRGYDVQAYYRKLLRDLSDAQTASGLVPDIAPEYTEFSEWDVGYRDDANWGGSLILAPWLLYRTYGDREVLDTYYPNMQRYLRYLDDRSSGDLLGGGLGDWIAIDTSTPRPYTASYAYLRLTRTMGEIATTLGRPADAAAYAAKAERITAAFNATYLDAEQHTYATGSLTADALPLQLGIVPADQREAVLAHLIANIRAKGNHLDVGEIGLPAVLDVLSDAGRDDVVYDLATQTTAPSYGAQLLSGSTSLGESWEGMAGDASQNHFMLGAIDEWFTKGLGGIRQAPGDIAFRELEIRPAVVGDLASAQASYRTTQGTIRTAWQRDDGSLTLRVEIPANTIATVRIPLSTVGGPSARLTATAGARPLGVQDGHAVYAVGSGSWTFTARHA